MIIMCWQQGQAVFRTLTSWAIMQAWQKSIRNVGLSRTASQCGWRTAVCVAKEVRGGWRPNEALGRRVKK